MPHDYGSKRVHAPGRPHVRSSASRAPFIPPPFPPPNTQGYIVKFGLNYVSSFFPADSPSSAYFN